MTQRSVVLPTLGVLLWLSWAAGCSNDLAEQKGAPPAPGVSTYHVAVLGDGTRTDLLRSIAAAHEAAVSTSGNRMVAEVRQGTSVFRLLSASQDSISTQAGLAWEADLVLLAVDATKSSLPVHREHVLVARQMAVPAIVIAFTKSGLIKDPELLELEELELRDLLNKYYSAGNTAACVFDHPTARTTSRSSISKGFIEIVRSFSTIARKRSEPNSVQEDMRFRANVYSLGPQEAFLPDVATAVKSGPTNAIVGGESITAEVTTPREIPPGEHGEIEIAFSRPVRVGQGQRFLLINKQHVAAAGFLIGSTQQPAK
jgi:translation elongation factor EF-Tu-like GTPase